MTYELVCSKCGHTIYSGFDLRSPNDILKPMGYSCKKCGDQAEPEQLQGRRHEARGKVRLAEYPRLRIYTHWSARTANLEAGYFAFPIRLPFTPLTRTNGVASSDSPMTSWAAEQRSSAIAWLVTLRMLPNRSSFPRRSTTASRPAAARATPVVPRRVGMSRLSETTHADPHAMSDTPSRRR